MKTGLLAVSLTVSILVALPAGAAAAAPSLPAPKQKRIVVPTEIAGVKPGMKLAAARAAWGKKRGRCYVSGGSGSCRFGEPYTPAGDAEIGVSSGRVRSVTVRSYWEDPDFKFSQVGASLRKMRTPEGFGLGTVLKAVIRKYSKGNRRDLGSSIRYEIKTRGSTFSFTARASDERVTLFAVVAGSGIVIR